MSKKRKAPKRRNTVAKSLRSPALRQRVIGNKKKKAAACDWSKLMANNWHGIDRF